MAKTRQKLETKNDNDIGYTEFMNQYSVYLADGTMVPTSVKKEHLFLEDLFIINNC